MIKIKEIQSEIDAIKKIDRSFIIVYLDTLSDDDDFLFSHLKNHAENPDKGMVYKIVRKADNGLWLHLLRHKRFADVADKLKDRPYSVNALTHHKRMESDLVHIHGIGTREDILSV